MAPEGPGVWEQEIVWLGEERGITVLRDFTVSGHVVFATPGGDVEADVFKALEPDVALENVAVYLVQKLDTDGQMLLEEYALMVDDPYWGRRVQGNGGSGYEPPPYNDVFVMGYRIQGRILHDGEPVNEAKVSLGGVVEDSGGTAIFWDSLEYNELIWSDTYDTFVEGPTVYAPIMTGEDGRWSWIVPKGHGAIYQREQDRRDDSEQTAAEALPRKLTSLAAVYLGRRAELTEGVEAVIDIESGQLVVSGEAGAWVRVSTMDDIGSLHLIGAEGSVTIDGLPAGEHAVVQFVYDEYGWDSDWGCARQTVQVVEGGSVSVDMGLMEYHDPGLEVLAGRVYERMGVPAAGIAIVPINFETGEVLEPIAITDAGGYWEAEMPPGGLGGDPWIHDDYWGSMPVLGYPYSDVVLGARAYAGWLQRDTPEAWRKGSRGHSNFPYVQDGVHVRDDDTLDEYGTVRTGYGGWATEEALPKWRFVADVNELLLGPQLKPYALCAGDEVLADPFYLASQSFEEYETLPGQYRAAGYYPEYKFLIGGKIHGGVVTGDGEAIGLTLPEAARIGLEFGEHEWLTQVTAVTERSFVAPTTMVKMAGFADLVCPYCGGPAWRDPDAFGFVRGHCWQCAQMFGNPVAMDCRTHFTTPALGAKSGYTLEALQVPRNATSRKYRVRYHWRPDVYDENDVYLTQSGPGQATNAPRWFARHVDQVGDGLGFGEFDAGASPPFTEGHDLAWFGARPEVQRALGLTQMKLVFPYEYVQAADVTVELDCRLANGTTETVQVVIPAGVQGPDEGQALSDVVRVKAVGKWVAEGRTTPYAGCGLYEAVVDARLVGPAGAACQFTIVNDVPLLASASGVTVRGQTATPAALQLGLSPSGDPHLMDDGVGQIFLFYAREGDIWMRRRAGLPGTWRPAQQITTDGDGNARPCAEKDEAGRLRLYWQKGAGVESKVSADDGNGWA